jgi:YgiT-type zinc finger domain-containing protein
VIKRTESKDVKCSIEGCPGEYEEKKILQTLRERGRVIVIDHVPAEVCSVCGDVLLKAETVRRIETLLQRPTQPVTTLPLYEYA